MTNHEMHFPTPAEIDAQIAAAHRARAAALAGFVRSAARWLAQSRTAHRAA